MLHKKDTSVVTLALLCALAAAEQPAAASTFAAVLAQTPTPTPTALPSQSTVPGVTKLRIVSSSSMEKFNAALKQRFEQQFPGKEVTIGYGDATAALRAVRQEQADLAAIGRPLTRREKARGLVEVPVTRNKIAIVVGANNPFTGSLTDQQFAQIFRGEIQDWSVVGGAPGRIRVIDRPETSDIRQTLREYPVFQPARFYTGVTAVKLSEDSTQAVIRELGNDGIGIAIADEVINQPGVRVLPMHQTTPDDPRYPFSQRLFYVYKKTNTSAPLQNFLAYATATQGQSAIAEARTVIAAATPAATPLPATAAPGATIPPQPLTPAATPLPATAAPGATIPPQPLTPAATASPQTTTLTTPAADTIAATSTSDKVTMELWWVWVSGLLVFLVWGWLKNKRSHPESNQHLSLSSLDLIEPATAPTSPRREPWQVPAAFSITEEASPTTANQAKDIALSRSRRITSSEITPSAPIPAETESAPVAATPSVATSGLVAWSEIATKGDIAPSKPTEEQESSPTASALKGETPEAVSNITDTALKATGNQVEDTTSASDAPRASDAVAEGEIAKEGDISPSQAITTQQQSSSTASSLTAETPAELSQVTEDTNSTNSLPIEAAAIATASDREASSPEQTEKPTLGDERSTIVLLSRQPEWAYAYWNIPNQEKQKLQQQGVTKLALRLYDVTDIDLDRQQPESIAQDDCNEDSRDAYLMIPAGDRDYMVEIGYVAESDRWIGLARSAVVRIPPASDRERQLAEVEFEAMRLLSVPPVSPSILSSSGGRLGVTSLLATSDNGSSASAETTRRGKFRVVADAELSVYGETEPDAKVTIDGRPIEINPTGTFRCQMLCPDGESEFTITAVGADGETDSIQIKLTRQTLKPNRLHST